MKRTKMILAGALLWAAPAFCAVPQGMAQGDENDGSTQVLTVSGETENRTVKEIRIDGNNAELLFTNGETLAVDMQTVVLTMDYSEATGVGSLRLSSPNGGVKVYNLQGNCVTENNPQSGVYIVNGKKVSYKKK